MGRAAEAGALRHDHRLQRVTQRQKRVAPVLRRNTCVRSLEDPHVVTTTSVEFGVLRLDASGARS